MSDHMQTTALSFVFRSMYIHEISQNRTGYAKFNFTPIVAVRFPAVCLSILNKDKRPPLTVKNPIAKSGRMGGCSIVNKRALSTTGQKKKSEPGIEKQMHPVYDDIKGSWQSIHSFLNLPSPLRTSLVFAGSPIQGPKRLRLSFFPRVRVPAPIAIEEGSETGIFPTGRAGRCSFTILALLGGSSRVIVECVACRIAPLYKDDRCTH
ncbi:hypothetical protein BO86DRAFT_147446 [Aspergillus japonicus CBS 114.51]|uniref:Uncharacterized protein n=1 Tax=Aspergillus japonicus CBS 114.51 TaxID=1448312 RepID=A0A8T8WVT9_ASPJA|nr:hypothetical protein BO86DRAFT_147446 [Aspergillus japonicus CBS 114.51]RAH79770.1 hypothetical protein BO86DRAFT_147446 [Aspergillus japonicus CBS 114.51]